MTEWEKMLSQRWFDNMDPRVEGQRRLAAEVTARSNATPEDDLAVRRGLLEGLLGHIGENSFIAPGVRFDYGCTTCIGDDVYVNFDVVFLDGGGISVGDRCLIGPRCSLLTPVHPLLPEERACRKRGDGSSYQLELARPVVLEDDVWLGGGATVLPGVTIGHGSVIGAGSVVTRDVPAGVVAVGNPCRVVREITDEERHLYRTGCAFPNDWEA